MPGVPEIGLPQGICWESHDESGREPRRQGTVALSTQGAQPGSPEDNRWPLSLAVTLVCANPNPTPRSRRGGGVICTPPCGMRGMMARGGGLCCCKSLPCLCRWSQGTVPVLAYTVYLPRLDPHRSPHGQLPDPAASGCFFRTNVDLRP